MNERYLTDSSICYHRANSVAKALRAASVVKCIEFDLVVDNGTLSIRHPPSKPTGFQLMHVFDIADFRDNDLWIDSKNIQDPAACEVLAEFLEEHHSRVGVVLVEFPSNATQRHKDLYACSKRIQATGARTSYYVPTDKGLACSADSRRQSTACVELEQALRLAVESGLFTDFSFDFSSYSAMKEIPISSALRWNTWSINLRDFESFPRSRFGFVIVDTSDDPNGY